MKSEYVERSFVFDVRYAVRFFKYFGSNIFILFECGKCLNNCTIKIKTKREHSLCVKLMFVIITIILII